jgi:hypothetical protein
LKYANGVSSLSPGSPIQIGDPWVGAQKKQIELKAVQSALTARVRVELVSKRRKIYHRSKRKV